MSAPTETPRAHRRAIPVRVRLLAIALLPTLVVLPLLLGIAMVRWNERFDALLLAKVRGDLTIARQYFERILEITEDRVEALGQSARFQALQEQPRPLSELLDARRREIGLDFLYLMDGAGTVIASALPMASLRPRADWPVVAAALAGGTRTAVDVFSQEELAALSPTLAERAIIPLVPTPNADPTERERETQGMVVHTASGVRLADGRMVALVGGILLNRNLVFIDTINDLVYRDGSLTEGSAGTATLFLGDVRISTNVRLFEGHRALGTRVSSAVRRRVLDEGKVWLGSALVVNERYISAYEPITGSLGQRIGMLYVGFSEAPFARAKLLTLLGVIAAFALVSAASVPIFLRWARSVFKPLERMDETIARAEAGDRAARTALAYTDDELGRLARNLDRLLDLLAERERDLVQWNDTLARRVEERTHALELANREIEATTRQLIMSEKLATVGEVTAGVAHEINNPLAAIQGNLDVLRETLARADEGRTEFRLIDAQIGRIREIVSQLLQFSRPEEYSGAMEHCAPAEAITDCLGLLRALIERSGVRVERDDQATRRVTMSRTELQQVLVNLMVNAIHAMPEGGRLMLRTHDMACGGRSGVGIVVADTGSGMGESVMARIFDPFFTTKAAKGHGLGLSITRKLVTRRGGDITVASAPGEGAVFTLFIPSSD